MLRKIFLMLHLSPTRRNLMTSIKKAIASQNIPPETLQILLNLAEFMEHYDKALHILAKYSGKCHAFAKALHYKELDITT